MVFSAPRGLEKRGPLLGSGGLKIWGEAASPPFGRGPPCPGPGKASQSMPGPNPHSEGLASRGISLTCSAAGVGALAGGKNAFARPALPPRRPFFAASSGAPPFSPALGGRIQDWGAAPLPLPRKTICPRVWCTSPPKTRPPCPSPGRAFSSAGLVLAAPPGERAASRPLKPFSWPAVISRASGTPWGPSLQVFVRPSRRPPGQAQAGRASFLLWVLAGVLRLTSVVL